MSSVTKSKDSKEKNFDHLKRSSNNYREFSPSSLSKRKITKSNSGKISRFSISKMTASFMKKITKTAMDFINSRSKSRENPPSTDKKEKISNFSTPDFKSRKPSLNSSILDSEQFKAVEAQVTQEEKEIKNLAKEVKLISDSKNNLSKLFNNDNNQLLHHLNLERGLRLDKINRKSVFVERSKSKLEKSKKKDNKKVAIGRLLEKKRMMRKLKNRKKVMKEMERLNTIVNELVKMHKQFLEDDPALYNSQ